LRGARGKDRRGRPGSVLLVAEEPEKSGGKLEDEMGGTKGLDGALMGGEEELEGGILSEWERGLGESGVRWAPLGCAEAVGMGGEVELR
jgi:hypothetical protein